MFVGILLPLDWYFSITIPSRLSPLFSLVNIGESEVIPLPDVLLGVLDGVLDVVDDAAVEDKNSELVVLRPLPLSLPLPLCNPPNPEIFDNGVSVVLLFVLLLLLLFALLVLLLSSLEVSANDFVMALSISLFSLEGALSRDG